MDASSEHSSLPAAPRSLKRSKSKSETYVHDQLQGLKDEAGLLRLKATQLVAESDHIKRQIARFMKTHHHDVLESPTSSEGEEHADDHRALANEALAILSTISIDVSKMRAPSQSAAFQKVDQKISVLELQLDELATDWDEAGLEKLRSTTQQLVNAADPDPSGAIDSKFQSQILGCSLFDQKSTRARLADLLAGVEDLQSYMEAHPERRPSPSSRSSPTVATPTVDPAAPTTSRGAAPPPAVAAASARSAARSGRRPSPSPRAAASTEDYSPMGHDGPSDGEYEDIPRQTAAEAAAARQDALRRSEQKRRAAIEAHREEARRLAMEEARRRERQVAEARLRAREEDAARRQADAGWFDDPFAYSRRAPPARTGYPFGSRQPATRRPTSDRIPSSRTTRAPPFGGWGGFY